MNGKSSKLNFLLKFRKHFNSLWSHWFFGSSFSSIHINTKVLGAFAFESEKKFPIHPNNWEFLLILQLKSHGLRLFGEIFTTFLNFALSPTPFAHSQSGGEKGENSRESLQQIHRKMIDKNGISQKFRFHNSRIFSQF